MPTLRGIAVTESAIYRGKLTHQRFEPTQHQFAYDIFMFWLKLDELDTLSHSVKGFGQTGLSAVKYRREDYLGDITEPLETSVLNKMSSLAGKVLTGDVFMLGQVRTFGLYFSPVNFYYLRDADGLYSHMLAEVSNTPWNERHHYLVDLTEQADVEKVFHVSPFNPLDMMYKWQVAQPSDTLSLSMECHQSSKHFSAGMNLRKIQLNSVSLRNVLIAIPSMTIKTVWGIYWQALKLWLKRTPIYEHPANSHQEQK